MLTKAINQGALAPLCGDTARISNFVCYPATPAQPAPPAPPRAPRRRRTPQILADVDGSPLMTSTVGVIGLCALSILVIDKVAYGNWFDKI